MRYLLPGLTAALLALGSAGPSFADTLTVGVRVPITSIDPQLSGLTSDLGYNRNIYSTLFDRDPTTLRPQPGLATEFKQVDDLTWIIKLRAGVTFHNGDAFTAADVVSTFARLPKVPGSDGLLYNYVRPVKAVEVVDPLTVKLTTSEPTPNLIDRLATVSVICRCTEQAVSEDFNTGKAAIGTGPFRVREWQRGNRLVLERFDAFWGPKSEYDQVVVREMSSDPSRVAALLSGDVDAIDGVPPDAAQRLSKTSGIKTYMVDSARTLFMRVDMISDMSSLLTDPAGLPLPTNPLKDVRVRRALALATGQDIIISRIMEGLARPITQGVTATSDVFDAGIRARKFDPREAKKLLADAGFPSGFGITIGCPNDRWINDADICQAVAQMWSQAGLKVKVDAMPKAVFFKRYLNNEFPAALASWGRVGPEDISFITDVLASRGSGPGRGSWNPSYANPKLDETVNAALGSGASDRRNALLKDVMAQADSDVAYFPLHSQAVIMATRGGISAVPSADEGIYLALIRRNK